LLDVIGIDITEPTVDTGGGTAFLTKQSFRLD
jgi:hypothetical protein